MSRVTKWKLEKTKVKVVFRLQFHATHVPQTGWDKLYVSLTPAESGKATAKTTKANVRNGTCKWGDPIYETTRLLQDVKTKQLEEKLYKLVVAMGSSRSSVLGEACIDLADYADALKPTVVQLPLKGSSDSGALLHVTVQLLTSKTGFREFEQQREISERGLQASSDHEIATHVDKVSSRGKFRPEQKLLPSLEEEVGLSSEYADLATGLDVSSNTSESLYAEKHDADSVKSTMSGDTPGISLSQIPTQEKGDSSNNREWVHYYGSDNSVDHDLGIVYREDTILKGALEAAEMSVNELKKEVTSLEIHTHDISSEMQKLTVAITDDISYTNELEKNVSMLKSECSRIKDDIEQLRNLKINNAVQSQLSGFGLDVCQPEDLLGLNIPNESDANKAMQGEMFKLLRELDESKSERESLTRKMDQMECYYEALIQELEENQKQMLGELQSLRNEHSNCMYTLCSNKVQMEAMHQEMGNMDSLSKELERRAITAEAALKRARLNYSIAVNQLQKDLEVLSLQVLSMYETNESLLLKAFSEEDIVTSNSVCRNQKVVLKDLNDSLVFQEELYKKIENEVNEINLKNIYLDVFARSLQETLQEAVADSTVQNCKMNNQALEANLKSLCDENCNLAERIAECEALLREYETYKSRYEVCDADKTALTNSLEEASAENKHLVSKISLLEDEMKKISSESDEFLSSKQNLQKLVDFLREKLQNMLSAYGAQIDGVSLCHEFMDAADVASLLENHQNAATEKMLQLMKEKKDLEEEHDIAKLSLKANNSEVEALKKKFEVDIGDMSCKLEAFYVNMKEELLSDVESQLHDLSEELAGVKLIVEELNREKQDLSVCLQSKSNELILLESETSSLKESLRSLAEEMSVERNSRERLENELADVTSALDEKNEKLLCFEQKEADLEELTREKQDIVASLQSKSDELALLESEISSLKEGIKKLSDELSTERNSRERLEKELSDVTSELDEKKGTFLHLEQQESEKQELISRLQNKADELLLLESETNGLKESIGSLSDELSAERNSRERLENELADEKNGKLLSLLQQEALTREKQDLLACLRSKTDKLKLLESEISSLKGSLISLTDELSVERNTRDRLQNELADATSEVDEKNRKLAEFVSLRKQFEELELEKLRACDELCDANSQLEEKNMKLHQLEQQQAELVLLRTQFLDSESERSRVCSKLMSVEKLLKEALNESTLISNHMHEQLIASDIMGLFIRTQCECQIQDLVHLLESSKNHIIELNKKNLNLQTMFDESLHREANYGSVNTNLQSEYESLKSQLEEYVAIAVELEQCKKNNSEAEQLKVLLSNSVKEIDTLMSSRQELEIICTVLKSKLNEQFGVKLLLEQYENELTMLQKWCDELSLKLSEQTLKTEEFKNLSVHLKELKDKKEEAVSSVASQDSLRIAFIKEQYETKVQELRQQLSISKKHGEEMLMRLQDAIDEVEKRRKTEAIHLKRNEELSLKILELEDQLSSTLSDNRDRFKDYDQVKAELECSLISLECCKEEKQKLVVSLEECNDEKNRINGELSLMRECLSSSAAAQILTQEKDISTPSPVNGHYKKLQHTSLPDCGEENKSSVQIIQDDARGIQAVSVESTSSDALSTGVDQLKAQNLKSSMDFLHKELEKMKSENSLLSEDDFEPHMEGLRRELIQLEKVNEELENMSPEYKDYSSYGNSIERVLALVMELAEALKAKKTSTLQFQSSFLKQHNDETAIFRSFKDINDLIKDMLELKGKYNAVETELREMHERYSALSIQFAEVEGERQKLMMMLKNTRSPRRLSGWGLPGGPAS